MIESSPKDQFGGWLRVQVTRKSWSRPRGKELNNRWPKQPTETSLAMKREQFCGKEPINEVTPNPAKKLSEITLT